jgi:protein-arginine kinase activator protein McsA
LEQWREEVLVAAHRAGQAHPEATAEVLRRQLQLAISEERFEDAAALRDEIRRLAQSEE